MFQPLGSARDEAELRALAEKNFNWQQKQNNNYFKTKKLKRRRLKSNMSKRLWTETRQVGAKNSTQKLSKTKAKLSQAEPS